MKLEKPRLESSAEKAHDLLASKKEQIDINEFKDLYSEEVVSRDSEKVDELEKIYEQENTERERESKRLSNSFEILMTELAELENWLGENVFVKSTSKYDDIVNGVDMVAEFSDEGKFSHLGLAIDITFSSDVDVLSKKISRIIGDIKRGELAKVKYYKSDEAHFRGELSNIPRVVIGTDRNTLDELADLWLRREKLRKSKMSGEGTEAMKAAIQEQLKSVGEQLRDHRIQKNILKQVKYQLEKFADYADSINKSEISAKLRTNLKIIEEILSEKSNIEESADKFTEMLEGEIDRNLNT